MAARRIQFSLAMLLLTVLVAAAAVAISRPWLPGYRDPNVLPWRVYSPELVKRLRRERKPIVAFFAADWDLTAQALRVHVLNTRDVRIAIEEEGFIPILVNCTDRHPGWPVPAAWTELKSLDVSGRYPLTIVLPSDRSSAVVLTGGFAKEDLISALHGERKSE